MFTQPTGKPARTGSDEVEHQQRLEAIIRADPDLMALLAKARECLSLHALPAVAAAGEAGRGPA